MCDVTNLFKATVKTVKTREKLINTSFIDKSILPKSTQKSEFTLRAKTVVSTISKLKDFLLEHRKEYLNVSGYFGMRQSSMSDAERDKIDINAEVFVKTCKEAIQQLKVLAESHKVMMQVREHKENVLKIVEKYLSDVCNIYSEQRAIRVQRAIDRKKMSKLQTEPIVSLVKPPAMNPTGLQPSKSHSETKAEKTGNNHSAEHPLTNGNNKFDSPEAEDSMEKNLSSEESKMLHVENEQIFNEMSTMSDEIKQLEGRIVEISKLQNIFAEKVLEQEKDIDKVADTVVKTTENIKEANEVIREAMKNNAGLRVWILFFLLVLTFSLLFLDWYNA